MSQETKAHEAQPQKGDGTEFRPVDGGGNVASGEVLLIQAYAAMWLLAFGLVLSSIRKQRKLDARITQLQSDLAKARDADNAGSKDG